MKVVCKTIVILAVAIFCTLGPSAQAQYDSNYVDSFRGYLMPRLLLNRKTTGMNYHNEEHGYSLRYQPNKTFNIGVGLTYKFITLKVSVGILQPREIRGNTRDLDVQFHSYGKKFATDILAQFYKGFYLPDQRFGSPASEYYVRPDLAVSALGGSIQYIFNHRKFSYRAAFQQTELQKRSAGTFLLGMELFMGRFRADSTIVPLPLRDESTEGLRAMKFIEFGPNGGYAYSWVFKNFFITTGAALGLNAGLNQFKEGDEKVVFTGISPNTVLRVSTGYSVRRWGVNVLYLSTALRVPKFENKSVVMNTGTIRMNIIYRIYPGKRVKKILKPIDEVEDVLKD
jgi:hypothetical protein